jgi:L-alanine-DL-glutamate epimerase-like enolase superfamily enzyme
MKLKDWSLHFYRLPYEREVVWANAREDSGLFALLKLVSDTGVTGIAEGTIKYTWSGVSPKSLKASLEDVVLPLIQNLNLEKPETVSAALARIPENRLAKGLVDNACWTMRAAASGKPLWKLLEGSSSVEVCWTVTRRKPALMAAEAARYCERHGFRTLKVKGGQGVGVDLKALFEIRAAVGHEVALYVDANSHYPRAEAPDYVRRIAEAGATVAEDPSPLVPDAEFEALQRSSGIPILVDGSCTSVRDAQLYLARGAQAISLKPGRVGLSESLAIKKLIDARGRRAAAGIYAESTLGTLVNLGLPAQMPAEQTFFLIMKEQVSSLDLQIRGGRIQLPADPNLENFVDWAAVKRFSAGGASSGSRSGPRKRPALPKSRRRAKA